MKKILILDQHGPTCALLSLELTDAGYEVEVSRDAARPSNKWNKPGRISSSWTFSSDP